MAKKDGVTPRVLPVLLSSYFEAPGRSFLPPSYPAETPSRGTLHSQRRHHGERDHHNKLAKMPQAQPELKKVSSRSRLRVCFERESWCGVPSVHGKAVVRSTERQPQSHWRASRLRCTALLHVFTIPVTHAGVSGRGIFVLTGTFAQVFMNIVLDEAVEEKAGGEKVRLGMVVRTRL